MNNYLDEQKDVSGKLRLNISMSYKSINKIHYSHIIKLLLNVYEGIINLDDLEVNRLLCLKHDTYKHIQPYIKDGLLESTIDDTFAEIKYKGITYILNFIFRKENNDICNYYICASVDEKADIHINITKKLLEIALEKVSIYKNGCYEVTISENENINSIRLNKITPPKSDINNIFIEDKIKDDIERFIYAFRNIKKHHISLRYLLSGKPGVGKTEIIRYVIEQCSDYGCVLIPKNIERNQLSVLDFAKLIKPSIVCFDDIDLIFGNREINYYKKELGAFLSRLDGIINNNVFIIATTNDKTLVDIAASRPGRFNEIIDFGNLEKKFYRDLITSRVNNSDIVNLFEDNIISKMESMNVTGAYIVNLLSQVELMMNMNPKFDSADLLSYLERNHKGFYKSPVEENSKIGFNNM